MGRLFDEPPPAPPPQLFAASPGEYRSPRLRAKIATGALVLYAAGTIAAVLLTLDALSVARNLEAGREVDDAAFAALDRRALELVIADLATLAVCAVAFCLWTYRVVANARALGGVTTISPGWAVGYFFIPIVNLWKPYTALSEAWNASDPEVRAERPPDRTSALLLVWWIVWLSGRFGSRLVGRDDPEDAAQWISALHVELVSLAIDSVALVLAVAVIWNLTRRQEARAAALLAPARVA